MNIQYHMILTEINQQVVTRQLLSSSHVTTILFLLLLSILVIIRVQLELSFSLDLLDKCRPMLCAN